MATGDPKVNGKVEEAEEPAREVILSNGVTLHLRPVPPFLIRDRAVQIERPRPPVVMIEGKGREEENPNSPEYAAALDKYEADTIQAGLDIMLHVGVVSYDLPEGFDGPDGEQWVEVVRSVGVLPEGAFEDTNKRRVAWLRLWALATSSDIELVTDTIGKLSGISNREVKKATESFRSGAPR